MTEACMSLPLYDRILSCNHLFGLVRARISVVMTTSDTTSKTDKMAERLCVSLGPPLPILVNQSRLQQKNAVRQHRDV